MVYRLYLAYVLMFKRTSIGNLRSIPTSSEKSHFKKYSLNIFKNITILQILVIFRNSAIFRFAGNPTTFRPTLCFIPLDIRFVFSRDLQPTSGWLLSHPKHIFKDLTYVSIMCFQRLMILHARNGVRKLFFLA